MKKREHIPNSRYKAARFIGRVQAIKKMTKGQGIELQDSTPGPAGDNGGPKETLIKGIYEQMNAKPIPMETLGEYLKRLAEYERGPENLAAKAQRLKMRNTLITGRNGMILLEKFFKDDYDKTQVNK